MGCRKQAKSMCHCLPTPVKTKVRKYLGNCGTRRINCETYSSINSVYKVNILITVQTDEPNIQQMARFMIPNSLDCVHCQIRIFRLIASETHIYQLQDMANM
ncbi:hypothetical protein ACJW30_06G002800 [Castanea mollissima]